MFSCATSFFHCSQMQPGIDESVGEAKLDGQPLFLQSVVLLVSASLN